MRENSGHHQATDSQNHAWAYFELHAKQRIAVFNFFLVLSGFITAGLTAAIQAKGLMLLVGAGLGILLVLVSFIFWKFDQRVSFLIKNAERALIELESSFPEPSARLFSNEVTQTKGATSSGSFLGRQWTYRRSFLVLFRLMGGIGLLGLLVSVARYFGWIA